MKKKPRRSLMRVPGSEAAKLLVTYLVGPYLALQVFPRHRFGVLLGAREDVCQFPDHVLRISIPGFQPLEPVGPPTVDVRDLVCLELRTKVERFIVKGVIDDNSVGQSRLQPDERVGNAVCEIDLCAGLHEGAS